MNSISKVSDITYQDLVEYIRIPEITESDQMLLNSLLGVATAFIKNYTGQTNLDNFPEYVIVVFILVQDMWDNRTLYVDTSNVNKVVDSILGIHSINLLPMVTGND